MTLVSIINVEKTIKFAANSHLERHLRCAPCDRPNAQNKGEASRDNLLQVLGGKDVWGREEMALRGASAMVAILLVRSCAVLCMNSFGGTNLTPALGISPQSPGCDDYGDVPNAPRESVLAEEMMQNH